jgi:hypothetical protein
VTTSLKLHYTKLFLLISLLVTVAVYASRVFAEDATTSATTKKEFIQQRIDTRKENAQNRMDALKERIATREAALKARLQTFRNKTKAVIAERVNTTLGNINENQTDQMLRHLTRMSQILDKLEKRVNSGAPDIKDPSAAKEAIAQARTAIATAEAAVKVQAEKDYTIEATSESAIRKDARRSRDNLHSDLQAVRKLVIDARQAVVNAIRLANAGFLPTATRSGIRREGTPSGRQ